MDDAYSYIRFSSAQQAQGDSQRRQQEQIDAFVKDNNLILRDSDAFRDLGVSGFRGSNLKQGLGRFIAEVDAKKVKRGSYLIVESLDRLSRQRVSESLQLLMSLIEKGIRVVALNDAGTTVLDKDADFAALVITLGTMFRAHDESAKKSMRAREVWRQKKRNAQSVPVSMRCPEWLKFNPGTQRFEPIPDRVRTIKKIFALADQGIGRHRIVRLLNQQGIKSFRNEANGWQGSSMSKLLKNRALIGYYQPTSREYDPDTGKERRVVDGDEVPGYYPQVMDIDLFRRVVNRRHTRETPLVGRQGPALSNLFTGMIFCGWCGAPMAMCNKGPPPKGRRYLVCSKAVRGQGCAYRSWQYDHIEPLILSKLREIDFNQLLGSTSIEEELVSIRDSKGRVHDELETSKRTLANLDESLSTYEGKIPAGMMDRWNREEDNVLALTQELEKLATMEIDIASRRLDPLHFNEQLLKLYDAMDNAGEEEKYLLRVRLRDRLSLAIAQIIVRPLSAKEQQAERSRKSAPNSEEVDAIESGPAPKSRTVTLKFRNGVKRTILAIGDEDTFVMDIGTPARNSGD